MPVLVLVVTMRPLAATAVLVVVRVATVGLPTAGLVVVVVLLVATVLAWVLACICAPVAIAAEPQQSEAVASRTKGRDVFMGFLSTLNGRNGMAS